MFTKVWQRSTACLHILPAIHIATSLARQENKPALLRPSLVLVQGVAQALRVIVQQEGVAGLWRGSLPAIQRAALVNLGELTTYDQASLHGH